MVPDRSVGAVIRSRGTRGRGWFALRKQRGHRDRTSELRQDRRIRPCGHGRRPAGGRPASFGPNAHLVGLECGDHGPVEIGPKDSRAGCGQSVHRRPRRMTVRVAGPCRGHRDTRADRLDERLGRRGPTPVVRHLEQVDVWKVVCQQTRIDLLLDVPHEQEPSRPDLTEQHDRHIVDAGAAVRRHRGDFAADRPQHT